ncbi:hypothetical protein [Colwellia sp. TT2012]|uniref:hypothetical protein n=1 Tax=Colwellia sp. TT2012 TaxID=1720342 RepID=UPI00070FB010|nr:hypothetical protein [Colwellia sp. TT2012]
MKKTIKVTLLSLLVFPGVGHLLLKKYAIALGFIASFSYLLLGFVNEMFTKSQQVIDSIMRGEVSLDVAAIRQALIDQGVLENPQLTTMGYVMLAIWGLSAFDAYRIAKKNKPDNISE